MGTDLAVSGAGLPVSWGRHGRELPLLATFGYQPAGGDRGGHRGRSGDAGPAGAALGPASQGYDADVITVDADPLVDLAVLADPARITGVWQAGVRVKG